MKTLARIVLWCLVIYGVIVGLQACGSSKPAHRSKFDQPKYDYLEKGHRRWN